MFHIRKSMKKVKVGFLVGLTAFGLVLAGAGASVAVTSKASAQTCDKVNIIYCGLDGSSANGYIKSLRAFYNAGKDSYGNKDIKTVMQWSGFTNSSIAGMDTENTKVGTLYRNGEIKVGGKVIAKDTYVSARFSGGSGFYHLEGNVYYRKTTTSFANPSVPVLIHFNSDGVPDAGVMVHCGNALRFTPTVKPKPVLICEGLVGKAVDSLKREYSFTASAYARNTSITSYVFNFGDGQTATVGTSSTKGTTKHAYAPGKTYKATVTVNSKDIKNVTSSNCTYTVTVPKPTLTCDLLTAKPTGVMREYEFTAKATPSSTTITGYTFNFGDNQSKSVATNATTAVTKHTYADAGKTYTATVSVSSADIKNVTSTACKLTITTSTPNVTITKKVDGQKSKQVDVNQLFTYQLLVMNTGNTDLKNVVVTDPAPGGVTMISTDKGSIVGNALSYTIPNLPAKMSQAVNIKAKVTAYRSGDIVNKACVNAPEVNPSNPSQPDACDTATVTLVPEQPKNPNITITKYVGKDAKTLQVAPGVNYPYRVVVKNTGEINLTNVVITDTPDEGVSLVSAEKGTIENNTWTYTIPSLAIGQEVSFTLTARVDSYTDNTLVNKACVNAPEVNPGNPSQPDACDTATVTLVPEQPKNPNITITKYVGKDAKTLQVAPGVNYPYRVVVKNTGEINLTNVVITDTPDEGVSLVSAEKGTIENNTWTYTIPSLAIGQEVSFTLTARVDSYTDNTLVNKACVNAPEVNPGNPSQPDACDTATVTAPPETPTELPNTGAGSVIGIFGLVTVVSAIVYRLFLSRKVSRN